MPDNSAYVEKRLRMMGINRLSKEQKEEFTRKKEEYLTQRGILLQKIGKLENELSSLHTELVNARPSVKEAEYIHFGSSGCGLKTVFKIGMDTDQDMGDVFYCLYCDTNFQYSYSNSPEKDG